MFFWDYSCPFDLFEKKMHHGMRLLYKQAWEPRITEGERPMMLEWGFRSDWKIMKYVTLFHDVGMEHPLDYYKTTAATSATTSNLFAYAGLMAEF